MQPLKADDGVPTSNYTHCGTSVRTPKYTLAHTQPPPYLQPLQRVKVQRCPWTGYSPVQCKHRTKPPWRLRDFPSVLCILWMNEWHTMAWQTSSRDTRTRALGGKKRTGTHQTNASNFRLWGACGCSWNSITERMKRSRGNWKREGGLSTNVWLVQGSVPDSWFIVIGWEVWPHLKRGLLQFNDIEILWCLCWRGR